MCNRAVYHYFTPLCLCLTPCNTALVNPPHHTGMGTSTDCRLPVASSASGGAVEMQRLQHSHIRSLPFGSSISAPKPSLKLPPLVMASPSKLPPLPPAPSPPMAAHLATYITSTPQPRTQTNITRITRQINLTFCPLPCPFSGPLPACTAAPDRHSFSHTLTLCQPPICTPCCQLPYCFRPPMVDRQSPEHQSYHSGNNRGYWCSAVLCGR